MKTIFSVLASVMLLAGTPAMAGESGGAPAFMKETFPEQAVDAAFAEYQAVMGDAALDPKTKELIGLAVSAQVPCEYCVYYHTAASKKHGATDAQIKEALAVAASIRKWSTMLNGSMYDMDDWHAEVDAMFGEE